MAQTLAKLWTHLVFSTKDRFPFLSDKKIRSEMHGYLAQMLLNYDCETLIVGGVEDHVHSLFTLSRKYSIATVVNEVKRTSSIAIKEKSRSLAKFHWQGGYGAFSVSRSDLDKVIKYIETQEEHHKRFTFQDEYRALLKAYEVEYDTSDMSGIR